MEILDDVMIMDVNICLAVKDDVNEVANLYDVANEYYQKRVNYSGWEKGIYPVIDDAKSAFDEECLYVVRMAGKDKNDGEIVASIVLNSTYDDAYHDVKWNIRLDSADVLVIHTLVVHPEYRKYGIAKKLIDFAHEIAIKQSKKAIILDTYEKNLPAINLYEQCGFNYVGQVDLGLSQYGRDWFNAYEKML